MFSLIVSCSRHWLVLSLGCTYSEIVGFGVLSLGPACHKQRFLGSVGYICRFERHLVQPFFFMIVSHTCLLRWTLAFNGFFCEAGSGSTTCRFSLGLRYLSQLSPGRLSGITETIEGPFTFPVTTLSSDRCPSSRVVINGIRSTTGVSFVARWKIPFLQGSRYHIA
jgi:hypothetical protein